MKNLSWIIIGKNIKALRESIGLSQHDFALVTDLSKRTIANIEAGNISNTAVLAPIFEFFNKDLHNLSSSNLKIADNYRETVLRRHKNISSPAVEILIKPPTIVYAIKFLLLKSTFLDNPRTIGEIKLFFLKHGWDYKSSSITNALQRMPESVELRPHDSKKNTNLYLKKKKN